MFTREEILISFRLSDRKSITVINLVVLELYVDYKTQRRRTLSLFLNINAIFSNIFAIYSLSIVSYFKYFIVDM